MEKIVDFGDLPVFEEATTYPCILSVEKAKSEHLFESAIVDTLSFDYSLAVYLNEKLYEVDNRLLQVSGWSLTDVKTQQLLKKLRSKGKPLGEYVNGKIYRGVLTGLNEAFIINDMTRERLITEDPASAEVIKPFLAGRDVKRYEQPVSDKFLIFTRRGIEIEKYPAILNYLEEYKERLMPKPKEYRGKNWPGRKAGTYKWYEIQDAVDYHQEFEKNKIIIPAIVKSASYAWDTAGNYGNDKTTIIPEGSLYLLGLLNSKLIDLYLKQIASTKQNGYYEYKPVYISQLPIAEENNIGLVGKTEQIVLQIVETKKENSAADTSSLEAEIDRLVYELYELTEEEIQIVENSIN